MEVTESDVRQYVQDATSAEDIERAIAVAATLRYSDLPEPHSERGPDHGGDCPSENARALAR